MKNNHNLLVSARVVCSNMPEQNAINARELAGGLQAC